MATFPSYVKLQLSGYTETPSNLIERTEMDRGPAKTRRTSSDPIVQVAVTMTFLSAQALADFRAWFYSAAGANAGAGWFDWRDPRTNTTRSVRFVSTSMGPIQYQRGDLRIAQRAAVFEYIDTIA